MATRNRVVKASRASQIAGPKAMRPYFPTAYGVPKDAKGLLPWSYVGTRMSEAMHYWVTTVTPGGRPAATPVDGLWLDDRLYFGGDHNTMWSRNLSSNPSACIHLESTTDVVILHGRALELRGITRELAVRLSEESTRKYGYGLEPEEYETTAGVFEFRPQKVVGWKKFPRDVTRWELDPEP